MRNQANKNHTFVNRSVRRLLEQKLNRRKRTTELLPDDIAAFKRVTRLGEVRVIKRQKNPKVFAVYEQEASRKKEAN